jgi:hypothetical protein
VVAGVGVERTTDTTLGWFGNFRLTPPGNSAMLCVRNRQTHIHNRIGGSNAAKRCSACQG